MRPRPLAKRLGCAHHVAIVAALLALAAVAYLARHQDAAARLWSDQLSLREGVSDAHALASPADLLAWVEAHPEHASLVVLDADGTERVAYTADRPRRVPSLPDLWTVAAWAQHPRLQLPGAGPREPHVLPEMLDVRRLEPAPATADTLSVSALIGRTVAGDGAAASLLLAAVGPARADTQAAAYESEGPLPLEGLRLAWAEGDAAGTTSHLLSGRLAGDARYREEARARFASGTEALSLREQRAVAAASFPRGTARGYARLLTDALGRRLGTPEVAERFLDATALPSSDSLRLGAKGGGFPGHLAFAAWSEAPGASGGRAAVLLLNDLPIGLFYHLSQTGLDAALVLELVTTDTLSVQP